MDLMDLGKKHTQTRTQKIIVSWRSLSQMLYIVGVRLVGRYGHGSINDLAWEFPGFFFFGNFQLGDIPLYPGASCCLFRGAA